MKRFLLFVCLQAAFSACTTMDAAHSSNGKRAYAAKAPKNKSAWRK